MVRWSIGLSVIVSFLCGCHSPLPPPKVVPPIGSRVALAAGDVWLVNDGRKRRVIKGEMLPVDASLVLDTGARALLRLNDGTGIFIRDNSELTLKPDGVGLSKGEMWVDVPADEGALKRFWVDKTVVTASGAGFDIAAKGNGILVYVARGLAIVESSGGRAEVESGEKAVLATREAKPEVKPVRFFADWTGGMADQGLSTDMSGRASGRIYGIDRDHPGALPTELDIRAQSIEVVIRDGIAQTTVDQRFFNPAGDDVEGWYWFTIPEDASVERFALEVNGVMVEGEMTERKQAAAAYEEAVQKAVDPALLEWVDGRNFRARIYPIPAAGERRVVLSYTQFLPFADGTYRYVYPMGGPKEKRIQEFSLAVDLGDEGQQFEIATLQDARVSKSGDLISIRRSGYLPKADFLLELKQTVPVSPLRTYRFSTGGAEADYVMVRYAPEEDFNGLKEVPGDVVVVVDTSAGGGAAERQIRSDAARAILSALSEKDRFAVVSQDLSSKVVYPESGLCFATSANVSKATEKLSEVSSAGATDIGEMFHVAFDLVHDAVQPAVVYIGDGRPTVGETDSLALAERLRRSLGDSRARLFTIAVGEGADHGLLERISRMGGGRAFRIDTPEQSVGEALHFAGMVKTPTITDLHVDLGAGLDQAFSTVAGKVSEGEEVIVLARSHHALPKEIKVTGRLAGKPFERRYKTDVKGGDAFGYLPHLWARMYLDRLMGDGMKRNRGTMISLGLSYCLMTPYTSFLVLESDQAFDDAGIVRRHRTGPFWRGFKDSAFSGKETVQPPAEPMNRVEEQVESSADDIFEMDAEVEAAAAPAPVTVKSERRPRRRSRAPRAERAKKSANAGGMGAMAQPMKPKPAMKSAPQKRPMATPTLRRLESRGVCSDASRRPLSQRRVIWVKQLERLTAPADWAALFFDSAQKCEVKRMRAKKSLLSLIEAKAHTPDEIRGLLQAFAGEPKLNSYLRRRMVRRTMTRAFNFNLYESSGVNWGEVERGLGALKTAEERLKKIHDLLALHPDDGAGKVLLVDALIEVGQPEDALAVALKLKRDGLAGTDLLETICDLQALSNESEAKRTCSELVEFSEADPAARQRLGDLFLRHEWFEAALRQYKTLVTLRPEDPAAHLRLAMAAAGMGRVDEALRIERKVATFDGEEGANDPRRFARLHSAVKMARMLNELDSKGADAEAERTALIQGLKRTGLFTEPMSMVLLTWNDLAVPLSLRRTDEAKKVAPPVDQADARNLGLWMINLGRNTADDVGLEVHIEQAPVRRDVSFSVVFITFDGNGFQINEKRMALPARNSKIDI